MIYEVDVRFIAPEIEAIDWPAMMELPGFPVGRPGHFVGELLFDMLDKEGPGATEHCFQGWRGVSCPDSSTGRADSFAGSDRREK